MTQSISYVAAAMIAFVLPFSTAAQTNAASSPEKITNTIVSDASERIELANQLPMLGQRVAAASCALASNVEVEISRTTLEDSYQRFERILAALQHGDLTLGVLTPEKRRLILKDIGELRAAWEPTQTAISQLLENVDPENAAHIIDDHNQRVLDLTGILASDIAAQYSHPFEITQSDALLISLSGRQRMLLQKMAKCSCEIWSDYQADLGRSELIETMLPLR